MTDEGLHEVSLVAVAQLIDDQALLVLRNLLVRLEVLDLHKAVQQLLYVFLCERFRRDLQLAHGSSPFVPRASDISFLMSTVDFLKKEVEGGAREGWKQCLLHR